MGTCQARQGLIRVHAARSWPGVLYSLPLLPMRRALLLLALSAAAPVGVGCDGFAPPGEAPVPSLAPLDTAVLRRAETLVAFFEHAEPVKRFGAVYENRDGRGYTLGWLGFTTASGSAAEVVRRYAARRAGTPLAAFLPELDRLRATFSGDVSRLAGLPAAWRAAAPDTAFQHAQDAVARAWYLAPAEVHAARLGLALPLTRAVLYDTAVQHGDGPEPDGLGAILARTGPRNTGEAEAAWLARFLAARRATLLAPANPVTADAWRPTVWRVDAWSQLLDAGALQMAPPLHLTGAWFDLTVR